MKTILLVDDDQGMIFSYGLVLRNAGYHVIEANSGSAALALARQHLPDLILSDIHMPSGDGSTLLQNLRNDPELKSKQIVLMTGKPDLTRPRRVMEEGADDFLVKPVTMEALLGCVEARFSRASISWRVEDKMLVDLRSAVPANLPHEFFTPMAGILGLMEILIGSPELTPAEVKEIQVDVFRSALRLNRTLRNYLLILDLQTPGKEPISAPALSSKEAEAAIWTGLKEVLRDSERQADITVRVTDCSISVKKEDLSRIIEELAGNAGKFSRQGSPIHIDLGSDGILTVKDEGRGMTVAEINRIGAFRQFDRNKYEQQGLGLGLILVQKICTLWGATFSLKSQPGNGTQAQVAFPMKGC